MAMNNRKTGPKLEKGVDQVQRLAVTIDDTATRMLDVAGRGNISAGIRHAARFWYAQYQLGRAKPVDEKPAIDGPFKTP
jgi:hypothetical protein